MAKPSSDIETIAKIVDKARQSLPWPQRTVLDDGSVRVSGLTEDDINAHIAKILLTEMAKMPLSNTLVEAAALAIFQAESAMLGVPPDAAHFRATLSTYRSAAMIGFRAILRAFAASA